MRRLPKQRFYRGLLAAKMITPKDVPLIERKMAEAGRYQQLNVTYTAQRGQRWEGRLQAFAKWLWANRDAILQVLGIIIMFAEDGTPIVREEKDLDPDTLKLAKQNLVKRKHTPYGEKVEDFTEEKPKPKRKRKSKPKPKVEETESETALDTLTAEAQEQGFYDLGLADNPLHKEETNDEVQPGEASSEATDRLKSDDV